MLIADWQLPIANCQLPICVGVTNTLKATLTMQQSKNRQSAIGNRQ